ncbi:TrlF family AAA-like ATPase [Arcicella rosea]|uniref:ABC-type lipoprotein export system ATPase subunit n=1 Tax=Arcicella rosea TaxID=502909 RepID=A0A841EMK2_9BACT|nr:PHP domain-containing protein [Arcicella rosea]MBB6005347.1 ABC-type lipoprotein export system ATPase subunit [Arcicella rosea]
MTLEKIQSLDNGAKFYRADLHIHSFGTYASYDVTDMDMTPQNIIDEAIRENISIISITDHNEIGNIPSAIEYAKDKKILVIPGVELSTSQGHFLVYFETYEKIRSFIGELSISHDKKQCDTTITNALEIARKYNGFGIAAHIDIDAGFENYISGYNPFKEAILKHDLLYGLEISNKNAKDWYSENDDNSERKRLFRARKEFLKEDNSYNLAKIMSSDAHKLVSFGKNISGQKKLTRIKLDKLDFNSFRVAFLDANSRIRIEDEIPNSFPRFIGIEFEGGILDKSIVHFSNNFNSLIGGRGTGKSTFLECLRAVSGNQTREDVIDNEVWPNNIKLYYEDEAGQILEFQRTKYNQTINFTNPENGIQTITIESFGQGETASTIQKCGKDPEVLLNFIDAFIDVKPFLSQDEILRNSLLENQTFIERLKIEIDSIPTIKQYLTNAKAQLDALKANKAKEVVEYEEGIANERTLRNQLSQSLDEHIDNISEGLNTDSLIQTINTLEETQILVGKEEFRDVNKLIEDYKTSISKKSTKVVEESTALKTSIEEIVEKWRAKEVDILQKIEMKRLELVSQGIKLDMSFIRKVTKDVSDFEAKLKELEIKNKKFDDLKKERNQLLKERKENLDLLYNERYRFIHTINNNLKGSVVDYEVEITIQKQNLSREVSEIIKSAMGYRTTQVSKSEIIVQKINHFELIKFIIKKDSSPILNIKNGTQQSLFNEEEANDIIRRLGEFNVLGQVQRAIIKDFPVIKIKKKIVESDNSIKIIERDFSKLSMGQQQSILLTLLLYSKRNCPLIIDQPEDNLDSEFIYKTLVKNLKRIKEHRQVIIVTHNANIAVLGDSELILPLKSTNEKTSIIERGSIDNINTNRVACDILEGGETAFKKRQSIYNIR